MGDYVWLIIDLHYRSSYFLIAEIICGGQKEELVEDKPVRKKDGTTILPNSLETKSGICERSFKKNGRRMKMILSNFQANFKPT